MNPPERTTADLIRDAPVVSHVAFASERVEAWRSRLDAASPLLAISLHPRVAALLAAIADHSPYLWRLVDADPDSFGRILTQSPEAALDEVLREVDAAGEAAFASAMGLLRRAKGRAALLVAVMDLGGLWDLDPVVEGLTRVADAAVAAALSVVLSEAVRSGKLRTSAHGGGLAVLALGKGGARELNYSSDIDIVVLYDRAAGVLASGVEPAPFYVRLTQQMVRLLSERSADGYVLRVDLRLRPDPGATAIALSLNAAFSYYEAYGQTWERAAFIKARPIAGDFALGRRFLDGLAPFVWRKYFDYAAIADIHAMKRQIHAVRGHAEVQVAGHDVKLGRGGIREIEFFVQTQQLIFGGRRPALRGARTLDMLDALHEDGWVSAEARAALSGAYRFLRRVEHRLQMVADEQTQRLPVEAEVLARFAAFAGYETLSGFESAAMDHMRSVETHYARLFEQAAEVGLDAGGLVFTGSGADAQTVETLRGLGFRRPEAAVETVRGWHFGRRGAARGSRAREILTELVPALLRAFSGSADPDAALTTFDTALGRMPAAVELFAILRSNSALRDLFADILGLAPRLAQSVVRRPHLLDIAIDPEAAGGQVLPRLRGIDLSLPTESVLDLVRDIAQDEAFRIGIRLLGGLDDPAAAGAHYADLAAAVIEVSLAHCQEAFARDHGRLPGAGCVVVALGRLGSREMTAASDLDLIVIYDADPAHPESDGTRRLDAARYFSRLTQRLISALTVTTRRGPLYEVDMRLRPSGRQGPVATRLSSFVAYQADEADVWEHMALSRARVVAGDPALAQRVHRAIHDILTRRRSDTLRDAVAGLRALVAREKGEADPWDLKLAAGGLLDIDFLAQYLLLRHASDHPALLSVSTADVLREAVRQGLLDHRAGEVLIDAARLYVTVTQIARLAVSGRFDPASAGTGLVRRLVAATGLPDLATLKCDLAERRGAVRAIFSQFMSGSVQG